MPPTQASARKRHGRHYTPPALAALLAERALRGRRPGDGALTVLDPACGDGALLLAVAAAARSAGLGPLELVGHEVDEDAATAAERRLADAGLDARVVRGDFLVAQRTMPSGSVDVVLTNPPYVRTQQLGADAARLLAREFGLTGRVDLTHPFVVAAARLLRPGGTLALLCSNRFLSTVAGANVRRTLTDGDLRVAEVVDLGDTRLFTAAVLPAVVVAHRDDAGSPAAVSVPAAYVSAYAADPPVPAADGAPDLLTSLRHPAPGAAAHDGRRYDVRVGVLATGPDARTPWRLSDAGADPWLRTVQARTWRTFGDVARVRVGIKTTADAVFVRDDWETAAPDVEPELLLPLLTPADVAPWRTSPAPAARVLYPYDLTSSRRTVLDLDRWPGARAYLLRHEERLRGRSYVTAAGRAWFEIWVPQRPDLWAVPKIVLPDISTTPRFALDTSGAVVGGACYWISLRDVGDDDLAHLLLGVANSALGLRAYDELGGHRLYAGRRRWVTQYVARLPLPDPTTPAAREVVAQARALAGGGDVTPDARARLDAAVDAAFGVRTDVVRTGT